MRWQSATCAQMGRATIWYGLNGDGNAGALVGTMPFTSHVGALSFAGSRCYVSAYVLTGAIETAVVLW
eukprot:3946443-Alexandrium_andersonii.AAC.1